MRTSLQSLYTRYLATMATIVAIVQSLVLLPLLWQTQAETGAASRDAIEETVAFRAEEQGKALADLVARQVLNPLYFGDVTAVSGVLDATRALPSVILVYVVDEHGVIVPDGPKSLEQHLTDVDRSLAADVLARDAAVTRVVGRELRIGWPLAVGSQPLGVLRMTVDLATRDADLAALDTRLKDVGDHGTARFTLIALGLSVALSLSGLVVGLILARKLAKPICDLAQYAEAIGRNQRRPPPTFKRPVGELDLLAGSLMKMADELRQRQAELVRTEKLEALSHLVAGIAHEVNTPVGNAITGASALRDAAEAFAERVGADKLRRRDLDAFVEKVTSGTRLVLENAERAGALVRTFKRVSSHEAGGDIRSVDLGAYLTGVAVSLRSQLRPAGIRIETDIRSPVPLTTDPESVAQLVQHLVDNALEHAFPDGTDGACLTLSLEAGRDDGAILTVSDNGAGMTEAVKARMWDPFFTTRRGLGSSGLGLHIVHNLVHGRLGGTIACETGPGRGTHHTIILPPTLRGHDGAPRAKRVVDGATPA